VINEKSRERLFSVDALQRLSLSELLAIPGFCVTSLVTGRFRLEQPLCTEPTPADVDLLLCPLEPLTRKFDWFPRSCVGTPLRDAPRPRRFSAAA